MTGFALYQTPIVGFREPVEPKMNDPNQGNLTADSTATPRSAKPKVAKRATRAGNRRSAIRVPLGKAGNKKELLILLLTKPNGARISMLVERLGWQSHTIRAALSRLRKQGYEITTSKSAKGDETVYTKISAPAASRAKSHRASE